MMLETGALDEGVLATAIDEKINAEIQIIFFMEEAVERIRCAVSASKAIQLFKMKPLSGSGSYFISRHFYEWFLNENIAHIGNYYRGNKGK